MQPKIIRVTIEWGIEGLFYAKSPDLRGLLVASQTADGLKNEIPLAIEELFEACDTPVKATEIENDVEYSWVAVPTGALAAATLLAH